MLCNIVFYYKKHPSFPGIFLGKVFREFSEFRKFPRNFPETSPDFIRFYTKKKLRFPSVKQYLYRKNALIFPEFSGKIFWEFSAFSEFPMFAEFTMSKFSENIRGRYTLHTRKPGTSYTIISKTTRCRYFCYMYTC